MKKKNDIPKSVLDTNILISSFFWKGDPRRILSFAYKNKLQIFTSPVLLLELEEVLNRPKFISFLQNAHVTPHNLIMDYAQLATVVTPEHIPSVVTQDPDDNEVVACALASKADLIISGDSDLLSLRKYENIPILSPKEFIRWFKS